MHQQLTHQLCPSELLCTVHTTINAMVQEGIHLPSTAALALLIMNYRNMGHWMDINTRLFVYKTGFYSESCDMCSLILDPDLRQKLELSAHRQSMHTNPHLCVRLLLSRAPQPLFLLFIWAGHNNDGPQFLLLL